MSRNNEEMRNKGQVYNESNKYIKSYEEKEDEKTRERDGWREGGVEGGREDDEGRDIKSHFLHSSCQGPIVRGKSA